jgi:hypothetical protein
MGLRSQDVTVQVPSALAGLTAGFEKEPGGPPPRNTPIKSSISSLRLVGRRCAHAEPTNTKEEFSQTGGLTVDTRQEAFTRTTRTPQQRGGKALDH